MSNLKFILKKEVELDALLQPLSEEKICLYANCDSVSTCVAIVDNYSEALELIQPNKIDNLFKTSMSGDELEIFKALLSTNPTYDFFDKKFVYIAEKE